MPNTRTKKVQFGGGRHLVQRTWDAEGQALLNITDVGEPHPVGEAPATATPSEDNNPVVTLRFPSRASAEAVRNTLNQIIEEWPTDA